MTTANLDDLRKIITCLTASDNSLRNSAEEKLYSDYIKNNPSNLFLGLSHFILHDSEPQFRGFCAVLLRRLGLKKSNVRNVDRNSTESDIILWEKVPEIHTKIQDSLLECIRKETDRSVTKKVSDVIAEIARLSFENEQWPKLLQEISNNLSNSNALLRESSFLIISSAPFLLSAASLEFVENSLVLGLQDPSMDVRLASLKASVQFLLDDSVDDMEQLSESSTKQRQVNSLVIPMVSILIPLNSEHNEAALCDALVDLTFLFESYPKASKPVISSLVPFLVNIVSDHEQYQDKTRQSSLELIVTLAENAPSLCKKLVVDGKSALFGQVVIPPVITMVCELDDDQLWYDSDNIDESDDSDQCNIVGEQALDRLSRALGGKQIIPAIFAVLPNMVVSSSWKERYGALMCISSIAEGCGKILRKEMKMIVEMILTKLKDPHPRVRYAACNAIGQLCTDFSPEIQEELGNVILSGLVVALDDEIPRVQAHAAAAIVNFCEDSYNQEVAPFLDDIVGKIGKLLRSGKLYVQQQAVTTLATLASSVGALFNKYYMEVMPVLLNILQSATDKKYKLLRGKVMECATLVAIAVGKEMFNQHVRLLISILKGIQDEISENDDPQVSYLITGWTRVCKVMGRDFEPYLPYVMPPLLKSAKLSPEYSILEADEDPSSQGLRGDEGWEFVTLHNQKFGLKTSLLDEKCTAVEMLVCYAKELGPSFAPYVEEIFVFALPLLKFYFHEGVRTASAALLPFLLISLRDSNYNLEKLKFIWYGVCSSLLQVIREETDLEVLNSLLTSLNDCIESMGSYSLKDARFQVNQNPEWFRSGASYSENETIYSYFCESMLKQLSEIFHQMQQRSDQNDAELGEVEQDHDNDEVEDQEIEVLANLSRVVHIMFKTQKESFWPYFKSSMINMVSGMLYADYSSSTASHSLQWSICVVDDIIEFVGIYVTTEIKNMFWNPFLKAIMECQEPDIRQAAAYGLGIIAFNIFTSGDKLIWISWLTSMKDALRILLQSMESELVKSEEQIYATENIISAIGKITRFIIEPAVKDVNSGITVQDLSICLTSWISYLPLTSDEEESVQATLYLLQVFQSEHFISIASNEKAYSVLVQTLQSGILDRAEVTIDIKDLKRNIIESLKTKWSKVDKGYHDRVMKDLNEAGVEFPGYLKQ